MNIDLESLTLDEIVKLQKEFLVKEWGKKLNDSDEACTRGQHFHVNGKLYKGYNGLARKYWPEEFENAEKEGYKVHVHHIDFNHSNNKISNLVVLTSEEHMNIHYMFDINFGKKRKQKISDTAKHNYAIGVRTQKGEKNSMYGKKNPSLSEWNKKTKGKHWKKDPITGKRFLCD